MFKLFIRLMAGLSHGIVLSEFSGLSDYKPIVKKNELPGRVCPTGGYRAFSLVEMLMALLVASLLLAALAPVMTRRLGEERFNVSNSSSISASPGSQCWQMTSSNSDDVVHDANGNRVIEFPIPPGALSAGYVNFYLASGGGGGGGASIFRSEPDNFTGNNGAYLKIEKNMDDFDIVSLIGGGGGGGGSAAVDESTTCPTAMGKEKCNCMGYEYDSENNVCVSRSQGSAQFSGSQSKCNALSPSNKWTVPTMAQLGSWDADFRNKIGVSGNVWSKDTEAYNTYSWSCTCGSTSYSGKASKDECCAPCSNQSTGSYYVYYSATKPSNWFNVFGKGDCTGKDRYCVCALGPSSSSFSSSIQTHCKAGTMSFCSDMTSDCNANCKNYCRATATAKQQCEASATSVATGSGTYYKYYQLSGSSWNAVSNSTTNTSSYNVYCVYNGSESIGSEVFYSLSGGGGASSPAIRDNNFNSNILNLFRSRINDVKGEGYIVLEVGDGGEGGAKSTGKGQHPSDGKDGEQSCIAITGSNKSDVKFRLCVPGGKRGFSADGTKANAKTDGYGKGGAKTEISDACYYYDYVSDGIDADKHTFDCSDSGNAGGDGGASTSNPTTGGKGASSILNTNQAAGGSASSVDGNTLSSTNYGAGGGGGTVTKTGLGTSGTHNFGKGGNGVNGYIYIKYNKKYDAAGGGGGGGGSVAEIREFSIGAAESCTFTIGKGGAGGNIDQDGINGGDTSVSCANSGGETFRVFGGEGGKKGISATTLGGESVGGDGGEGGDYSISGIPPSRLKKNSGDDGTNAGQNTAEYINYVQGVYSAGGRGGSTRGGGNRGGCGAMLNDAVGCNYSSAVIPNINTINGAGFSAIDIQVPELTVAEDYGIFGMGGGGGGWHIQTGSGRGGDGQGGYACIWWEGDE